MFDEKPKRARQLIERRDQIDEELRALFGEAPQPKRSRQKKENVSGPEPENDAGGPIFEAHQ
jgi:hypothetical protein